MNGCTKTLLTSATAVMLLASPAWAQSGSFDGSNRAAASAETNLNVTCGAQTGNLIRTENGLTNFNSTAFATLPGSGVTVTVPAGTSRCVKALFTAEAGATAFCYVRAVANGVPLLPDGGGFQALVSNDSTAGGHAFEWVRRLATGTYTISMQARVSSGTCGIDDWTFDVEVHS